MAFTCMYEAIFEIFICTFCFQMALYSLKNYMLRAVNFILQDIYCLDADGALFDAALLSAVAAFSHCKLYLKLIMLAVYFFFYFLAER